VVPAVLDDADRAPGADLLDEPVVVGLELRAVEQRLREQQHGERHEREPAREPSARTPRRPCWWYWRAIFIAVSVASEPPERNLTTP